MMFTDKILNQLISKYPAPTFQDRSAFLYEDLVESIVSQQLSIKAADTIFKRFLALFKYREVTGAGDPRNSQQGTNVTDANFGGSERQDPEDVVQNFPTPQEVLEMPDETIRTAGISFQKISYIKSVADAFVSDLIDTEKIKTMTDEEVIAALTQIRGVGKWTAEMILIFTLKRPDIFSIGDLGIRNAITKLYGITDQKEMLSLSEKWKPYRSNACWYLWRSLENKSSS